MAISQPIWHVGSLVILLKSWKTMAFLLLFEFVFIFPLYNALSFVRRTRRNQARLLCVLSADYQLKVVTVELPGVMCYSWNILFLAILKRNWLLLSTNCHNFKLQASEHIDLIRKVIMSGDTLNLSHIENHQVLRNV